MANTQPDVILGRNADSTFHSRWPAGDKPANARTITGAAYGASNSTPLFENFENVSIVQIPNSLGANCGQLIISDNTGTAITSAGAFSGTKALRTDYSVEDFPKIYLPLDGSSPSLYLSAWIKIEGTGARSQNWKFSRTGSNTPYAGLWAAVHTQGSNFNGIPDGFESVLLNSNGNVAYWAQNVATGNPAALFSYNNWMFYEYEFYAGTLNNSDAYMRASVNGVDILRWVDIPCLTPGTPSNPTWLMTPMCGCAAADGVAYPDVQMTMDNLYMDKSRQRVVITDNAVYANSTKWNTQNIISKSNSELLISEFAPSFTSGQTAHEHVFNTSGVHVQHNVITIL